MHERTSSARPQPVDRPVLWGAPDLSVRVLYTFAETGPATTIVVAEQLDQAGAPLLRRAWATGLTSFRGSVHLDLEDVAFCNAAGLAVLAAVATDCRERGTLLQLSAQGLVARLVRVAGLAVAAVQPAPPAVPVPHPRRSDEVRRRGARHWVDPVAGADEERIVAALVAAAAAVVGGVDSVHVALGSDRNRFRSAGAVGPAGRLLAEAEARAGEGPARQSHRDAVDVHVEDLRGADSALRWPRLAAGLAAVPVRSVMCVDLACSGRPVGTLTLTAAAPRAFDARARDRAETLAVVAAVTLVAERDRRQLGDALAHRDVIGQAKGILMERYRITPAAAFDLLKAASNHSNTKLHVVAARLTETGAL